MPRFLHRAILSLWPVLGTVNETKKKSVDQRYFQSILKSTSIPIILAPDTPFVANSGVNIQVLTGYLGVVAAWILIRDLCGVPR
jgi:hypothetical protein